MDIVAVLDVKDGQVVRAAGGDRGRYEAWALPCGPAPTDWPARARALLQRSGGRQLYVADLNALMQQAAPAGVDHRAQILALAAALPEITLWVDSGDRSLAEARARWPAAVHEGCQRIRPVLGTESLRPASAAEWAPLAGADDLVLSLDFRDAAPLDPAGLQARPACWPKQVVVMALSRVGSGAGPDLQATADCVQRAPAGTRVYGSGGLRGRQDLPACAATGAAGWLVATALQQAGDERPWSAADALSRATPGAVPAA